MCVFFLEQFPFSFLLLYDTTFADGTLKTPGVNNVIARREGEWKMSRLCGLKIVCPFLWVDEEGDDYW